MGAPTLFALHACAISRIPSAKSLWDWSARRHPSASVDRSLDFTWGRGRRRSVMRKSQIGFASRLVFGRASARERPFPPGFFVRALPSPLPLFFHFRLWMLRSVKFPPLSFDTAVHVAPKSRPQIHARRWLSSGGYCCTICRGFSAQQPDLWRLRLRLYEARGLIRSLCHEYRFRTG